MQSPLSVTRINEGKFKPIPLAFLFPLLELAVVQNNRDRVEFENLRIVGRTDHNHESEPPQLYGPETI